MLMNFVKKLILLMICMVSLSVVKLMSVFMSVEVSYLLVHNPSKLFNFIFSFMFWVMSLLAFLFVHYLGILLVIRIKKAIYSLLDSTEVTPIKKISFCYTLCFILLFSIFYICYVVLIKTVFFSKV